MLNIKVFAAVFLAHCALCAAQDRILDVLGDAADAVVSLPQETAHTAKDAWYGATNAVLGVESIFSDCFSVPNALCIGGTTQVITGKGVPNGLVGWWAFDEIYPVDNSGFGNHMHKAIRAGPGFMGHGASGAFVGGAGCAVPNSKSLEAPEFTIAFWIYLMGGESPMFRNVLSKGSPSSQTPTILLYPKSRRLSVRVSTDALSSEGMSSVGTIPLRRWTHVAVICSATTMRLYLNGVLDSEAILQGRVLTNGADIVVGATNTAGGFEGYLDDLRFYRLALSDEEISSFLAPAMTGIADRDLIRFGCANCLYEKAMEPFFCPPAYHLCVLDDLFAGGLHIARVNGWLAMPADVWHADMSKDEAADDEERMGLCCKQRAPEVKIGAQAEEA